MVKNGVEIDLWYGNKVEEVDGLDITFYPNGCEYRGNLYKGNKIIGDFMCTDSVALEETFSWIQFNWDN